MKRMTIQEKIDARRRRIRRGMIFTTARKLWQEDIRRTGRFASDYDYATDPEVQRLVDLYLADPTVRHIDIPAKAFRAYCKE